MGVAHCELFTVSHVIVQNRLVIWSIGERAPTVLHSVSMPRYLLCNIKCVRECMFSVWGLICSERKLQYCSDERYNMNTSVLDTRLSAFVTSSKCISTQGQGHLSVALNTFELICHHRDTNKFTCCDEGASALVECSGWFINTQHACAGGLR